MRLVSYTLTTIALSLLGTGLMSYALPVNPNALGSKLESLTHPLGSLKLIGREIHSADYGTAGKPQNSSSVANSGSSAPVSNPSSSSSSGSASNPKSTSDKQRRGKMRLMHTPQANVNQVADNDQGHKHVLVGRDATDYPAPFPREISNELASDHQNFHSKEKSAPSSSSMIFVGRGYSMANPDSSIHSNENNACGYYGYNRMRHVRRPTYSSFSRLGNEDSLIGKGTYSYIHAFQPARRLSPTEGGFWAKTSERVDGIDVSGGGGSRGIRHFDPREVDRMTAIYALSHGVPVGFSH